ncbi:MAG: hypothetical protein ACKVQC_03635 [Elusimicrobiota bacterium]
MDVVKERLSGFLIDFKNKRDFSDIKKESIPLSAWAVLTIWKNLSVCITAPLFLGAPPMHSHNRWKYVWKFRKLDFREISEKSRISDENEIKISVQYLIDEFMVYPDGSLPSQIEKLLRDS